MKQNIKKLLSLMLCASVAAPVSSAAQITGFADTITDAAAETSDTASVSEYGLKENIQDGTILHCFSWSYKDVTEALPRIAKAGFSSVQVMPIQNQVDGWPWWFFYQAVDLKVHDDYLNEINGSDELKKLCAEADKYGIKVIMDVVANHLSLPFQDDLREYEEEIGETIDYAEFYEGHEWLLSPDCWHEPMSMGDYSKRYRITHGELGMHDLNTENEVVQQHTLDFINDLKALGVDGIRWDAAKHIGLPSEGSEFWKVVTDTGLYNYGEIITAPSNNDADNGLMAEYAEYMSVTDTKYGEWLLSMFSGYGVKELDGNWVNKDVPANKLVYWAESHDTYSNNGEVGDSRNSNQNQVDRAYAVAASREGATALYFSRPASKVKDEIMAGAKGSEHYINSEVSAVNHFHNAMVGKKDCYAVSEGCAVVTRENGGAVIVCGKGCGEVEVVNAGGYAKPGTYKDEITGNEFIVTEDTIKGTVGESGIAVVYDSPYISRLYSEIPESYYITEETSVKLHCTDVTDVHYTLTEVFRGETVSETTREFKEGDVCTFGKDGKYNTHFILTLYGTDPDGRELTERTEYTVLSYTRDISENLYCKGRICFDNLVEEWKDVYVYVYDESGEAKLENKAYPGEKMTDIGKEYFIYDLPDTFNGSEKINLVFSNGTTEIDDKENIASNKPFPYFFFIRNIGNIVEGAYFSKYAVFGDVETGVYALADNKVDSSDALQILRLSLELDYPTYMNYDDPYTVSYLNQWSYYMTIRCDVDDDDRITASDALEVLRYSVGLTASEKIGKTILNNN